MPAQFLLNILIAFLWMLLQDEDELRFSTFAVGYVVGVAIVFLMHRFFTERFYLSRFFALIKLILIFISELLQSSFQVIKQILTPHIRIRPGIFKYRTVLSGDWEVSILALLLTLTPGSVVMRVAAEENVFYIHAMDVEQSKEMLLKSLAKFEKAIIGVMGHD